MMKLFVYVKDGPCKGCYGIIEAYEGLTVTICKLWVNMECSYACTVGLDQVRIAHCNILGYHPIEKGFNTFLEYVNSLPTCEG